MAKTSADVLDILIKQGTEKSKKKAEEFASKKAGTPVKIAEPEPQPFPQMLADYSPEKTSQSQKKDSEAAAKEKSISWSMATIPEITPVTANIM